MESLLTLSVGEFSSVELVLRLSVALMGMTALLLALTTACVSPHFRFPLLFAAIALGGATWFESGGWQSWKEAFELAGTSYCVTGHDIANQDRIIAWSLGVPAILFCFVLLQPRSEKRIFIGTALLLMALVATVSSIGALILLIVVGIFSKRMTLASRNAILAEGCVFIGLALAVLPIHSISLGGGASGELVRGEILRTVIDILSLVIPAWLLLIGILRLSEKENELS